MAAVNPGGDIQIFLSEVQMKRGEALETMPMIEDDTIAQELIEVIKKELEKRAVEKLLAKEETGKEDEMHFAMIDRETGETEKDAGGKQLDKIDEEIILESIAGLLKRQQVSEGSPPVADFVLEKTHKLRLIELMQIPRARKLFVQAIYEHPAVADEDEYKGGYSISPVSLSCLGELINSYLINVSLVMILLWIFSRELKRSAYHQR